MLSALLHLIASPGFAADPPPDLQAVYVQMRDNPMLYQVTEPHIVGGRADPVGSPCAMPPGTIFYHKPNDIFIYCNGKTWKRFKY